MSLASKHMGVPDKRSLTDNLGDQRMLHSLESCNFLKLDTQNYIHMDCTNADEYQMFIRQEYLKNFDSKKDKNAEDELATWTLYRI